MLAATGRGAPKVAVCHPVAVSPVKEADASFVPLAAHSEPVWVPVFPVPL